MGGSAAKKRSFSHGSKVKADRPTKKQRQIAAYHSSSDESDNSADEAEGEPIPANLLDSDNEDLDNVLVDDGASSANSDPDSDSLSESEPTSKQSAKTKPQPDSSDDPTRRKFVAKDAPDSDGDSNSNSDSDSDMSMSGSDGAPRSGANSRHKSKRNDPAAFATSISKMLASKLPVSKRADPIVARSTFAAERSRQAVDAQLEAKARKRLREQKRLAMEKGRVRDVLVASTTRTLNVATGEIEEVPDEGAGSTGQLMAAERRLRKVAQRGVVKLFNAVRAAQVKASEAERAARKEGIVGVKRKEEKVNEMSRKGFLDLIANSGGGLKKGGLEEA
ncbi:Rrp15p-domain-containing protein [Trichocladium antarcticum]|uniref:Rrp15p-domain-containing protein n=1 Tax=Trichocladium antarcticum TaxID=1450529 RepID=A0AAN6ZGP9_9PEZI|nr:Rrp15p-domain-containing protein [Trichocladium antarcticum]